MRGRNLVATRAFTVTGSQSMHVATSTGLKVGMFVQRTLDNEHDVHAFNVTLDNEQWTHNVYAHTCLHCNIRHSKQAK